MDGQITEIEFPLGLRPLKVNTMLSFDGFRACITGKDSGGVNILFTSMMPLILGNEGELYVKKMENFINKKEKNKSLILNEAYDGISKEKNQKLYDILASKVIEGIYSVPFSSVNEVLKNGYEIFDKLEEEEQVKVLLTLVLLLKTGRGGNCDLSLIGGKSKMGSYRMSSKLSNWKKKFSDVRIVNVSSSGIFEAKSINLLELLE